MNGKQEYGDYQTPYDFAERVCTLLSAKGVKPETVLEPTCGVGNFLKATLSFNAKKYYGIEINPEYCQLCKDGISDDRVTIIQSDIFGYDLKALTGTNKVLVVGNPPWVTNSALSSIGSKNLPTKNNFKGLKGLDAITGAGNFDICEYIILQLINAYVNSNTCIAMLCKTSVARNIFKELHRTHINFESCDTYEFNAQKVFGINASACLLLIKLTDKRSYSDECNVYSLDKGAIKTGAFGFVDGQFYSDIESSKKDFEGKSCFEWRQGVKHDCSKIMELKSNNGQLTNGLKQVVDIEDTLVFPLVKSSMFKSPVITDFNKFVIVTQKKVRDDTSVIKNAAPKTWKYLTDNSDYFAKRKSSIYRGAPPFSMFGVGDYSYSKYKVGISGFYKTPLFSVLFSKDGKPVMTDDTSYFICFDTYDYAYTAMLYLNSDSVQDFLKSIAFIDAKRPYTKKVLERIDFLKICRTVTIEELWQTEKKYSLTPYINNDMVSSFSELVNSESGLLSLIS
jgi:hypothetical protein